MSSSIVIVGAQRGGETSSNQGALRREPESPEAVSRNALTSVLRPTAYDLTLAVQQRELYLASETTQREGSVIAPARLRARFNL